jgi:hypothetical protein
MPTFHGRHELESEPPETWGQERVKKLASAGRESVWTGL